MMLSGLLLAGGRSRPAWVKVGQSLVIIDSLVHNFFHRTGILAAFDLAHQYGPRCYGHRGCAGIARQLADRIDARAVNPAFPKTAENGASDRQLMAIFGWRTERQANTYTRKASAKKMAADAMHLVLPRGAEAGTNLYHKEGSSDPVIKKQAEN